MKREVIAELSATSLVHNYQVAKNTAPGSQAWAVVKANAYGHGLEWAVQSLQHCADGFAVATLEEGLACRELEADKPVLVMQGVYEPDELRLAAEKKLQLGIHSMPQVELLAGVSEDLEFWLKLNTGMNRLGLREEEVEVALEKLSGCASGLHGLFTHFASADLDSELNGSQLAAFSRIASQVARSPGAGQAGRLLHSTANSAALFSMPDARKDVVRPGIMLYGGSPFADQPASALGLQPVMRLKARVLSIQSVKSGETVGYGETWQANRDTRLAVIGVGYGDGYPRSLDGTAQVQLGDSLYPVVGRVSMDTITVDVGSEPAVKPGDLAVLWGDMLSADELARSAGTISYEIFCKMTPRIMRNYG